MTALCVDDEPILLEVLRRAVLESPDISEAYCFKNAENALEWAGENTCDIAFIDIQLQKMNGLTLAKELRRVNPDIRIVFCTGYEEYALDAFKIYADGYLTKPIYSEDIQELLDHMKRKSLAPSDEKLTVRCFGNFEVYKNGEPLRFRRRKAKELFAFLIDRKGAVVTVEQIAAALWEDDAKDHRNHIYQLEHHLKEVLTEAGMGDALIISGGYAVNEKFIDCDYYNFLKKPSSDSEGFLGEYMNQYSWAEQTCGYLMRGLK